MQSYKCILNHTQKKKDGSHMKPNYLLHTKYLDKRAYMKKKTNNTPGYIFLVQIITS